MMEVHFLRCKTSKDIWYIMNNSKSRNVLFEECEFNGADDKDSNHWGGIDFIGGMSMKNCAGRHNHIASETQALFQGCNFDEVMMRCGHGSENRYAEITIVGCNFKNKIDMSSDFSSLTIRDTNFDWIDLGGATMATKDVLFENIKGGFLSLMMDKVKSLTLKNVELNGFDEDKDGYIYSLDCIVRQKINSLILENVKCAKDDTGSQFSGGWGNRITCGAINTSIKNCVFPIATLLLHDSADVEIEGLSSSDLYLTENVGKLHFVSGCEVSKLLSFTNIKAKEVDLRGMHIDPKAKLTLKDTNFAELEKEGKYLVQKKK
jgi:uncharacterized protein YjbI with pentapeptide repeats